jgi:hypothetical protein
MVLISPLNAYAEVMDKEPTLMQLYAWCGVSTIGLFLSARYRPKWLIFVVLLPFLFVYGQWSEITDKQVGPDILREAGNYYVMVSRLMPLPMIVGLLVGLLLRYHATRRKGKSSFG